MHLTARYLVAVLLAGGVAVLVAPAGVRGWVALGGGVAGVAGAAVLAVASGRLGRTVGATTRAVEMLAAGGPAPHGATPATGELAQLAAALDELADDIRRRVSLAGAAGRRQEEIVSALTMGVVVVDRDERVRYGNRAAARLLGGLPASLHALTPYRLQQLVRDVRQRGDPAETEVEIGHPKRNLMAAAVSLGGGREVAVTLQDVTEVRRVEAMRRDFVAHASHELKTPVAAIQAGAETIRRALADDPAAAADFAERIAANAARLGRLVSDLLDLSRLESELPALGTVDLARLVEAEAGRLQSRALDVGVQLNVDVEPLEIRAAGDDVGLAVRNLIENALWYTERGGRVDVRLRLDDGAAMVEVTDTGIGIPARDVSRVFERFYRVDTARSRATGGTGLGLSIVRHVAERHGGSVSVESRLGRGSTFRILIPIDGPGDR